MNTHRYRLQEYFDLLDGREEITESELRAMVDRFEGNGSLSTLLSYGGVFMTTILVLCGLVLAGGLFRQTDERSSEKRMAYAPLAQRQTEREDGERELHKSLRNPEGTTVRHRTDGRSPIAGNRPGAATAEDSIQLKLQRLPWGYRFVPGQKLLYEYGTTRIDPSNGDSIITVKRAVIEIEGVDPEGNITLRITTGSPALQIPDGVAVTAENSALAGRYRATITPLGEVVDGSIIYREQSGDSAEETAVSAPAGKEKDSAMRTLQREVEIWLPRWPVREHFSNDYNVSELNEKIDTVGSVMEDPNGPPPESYGPTVNGNLLRRNSTRLQAAGQINEHGISFRMERSEEISGRDLEEEESDLVVVSHLIPYPMTRKRSADKYQLDTASLSSDYTSIHLHIVLSSQLIFAEGNVNKTEEQRETGRLEFRKSDGALEFMQSEGTWFSGREEMIGKAFMKRNQNMAAFSSSLRLLQSDIPERESETDIPSMNLD